MKPKLPEEDEFEKSVAAVRLWELAGNAKMWLLVAPLFLLCATGHARSIHRPDLR